MSPAVLELAFYMMSRLLIQHSVVARLALQHVRHGLALEVGGAQLAARAADGQPSRRPARERRAGGLVVPGGVLLPGVPVVLRHAVPEPHAARPAPASCCRPAAALSSLQPVNKSAGSATEEQTFVTPLV
jgi:hypothetical protein